MKKILVISDVHGNEEVLNFILKENEDVNLKIYLGDFQMTKDKQKYFSKLFDYVVTGNCDYEGISEITSIISIENKKILITHGHYFGSLKKKIDFDKLYEFAKMNEIDLVLHGHDHIASYEVKDGIIKFNPGSTTFPRNKTIGSYGLIMVKDGKWIFNHIDC